MSSTTMASQEDTNDPPSQEATGDSDDKVVEEPEGKEQETPAIEKDPGDIATPSSKPEGGTLENSVDADGDADGDAVTPMEVEPTEESAEKETGVQDKEVPKEDGLLLNPTTNEAITEASPRISEEDQKAEGEESKPGDPVKVNGFIVEEESEGEEDVFSNLGKHPVEAKTKIKPRKRLKTIEIKFQRPDKPHKKHHTTVVSSDESDDEDDYSLGDSLIQSEILAESEYFADPRESGQAAEAAVEKALAFYAETHEDQDPRVRSVMKEKNKRNCQKELEKLALGDDAGRKEIQEIVASQLKEKQASADRNIERLRAKAVAEEQKDLQKLLQIYNEKAASNQTKIQHGIKLFSRRHASEMHKQAQQHRMTAQQRGIPEQMVNAEWSQASAQLQDKHRRQLQEFNHKGGEVKKKCEEDYLRERDKRRKHHEKRKKDMEHGMQKFISRMHQSYQQQHQRYLKRHVQRINKKKNEILARMNGLPPPAEKEANPLKDVLSGDKEERKELRAPLPIKSHNFATKVAEEDTEKGAAARHKHRKAILSTIPKQLGIEIHNEGLWVAPINAEENKREDSKDKDSSKTENKKQDAEFIPWGLKARDVLHTIVCGEIPLGFGPDRFDLGDVLVGQGGCIRCVVTDLRTGETTASRQRAQCTKEQEEEGLQELEKKVNQLTTLMSEADKNVQRAELQEKESMTTLEKTLKEVDKAKKLLHDFKTKFGRFFGTDGKAIKTPNPSDQQKLAGASHRYKSNVETADNKEKSARKAVAEAKASAQKYQAVAKQTQKAAAAASTLLRKRKAMLQDKSKPSKQRLSETAESERASARVSDVIGAFKKTADRRRDQLTQKRSSSASSTWVQGLPGIPGPLKKSLWHKMHRRRRQQIVLRPPFDYMVDELKSKVTERIKPAKDPKQDTKDDPAVRAEQLFLLAVHPLAPSSGVLSSVPSTATTAPWAEPGWHLVLDVPKEDRSNRLLPRPPRSALLQKNHIEVCSAPGRQAASFLRANHTKALSAPLSTVAQAISLAEINPLITGDAVIADSDPLNISQDAMLCGYQFSLKAVAKTSSAPRRKSATKSDADSAGESTTTVKKSQDEPSKAQQQKQQQHSKARTGSIRKSPITAGTAVPQPQIARRVSTKTEKGGRRRSSKKQQLPTEVTPRTQKMDHQAQVAQKSQVQQQVVPQQPSQQVAVQANMLQQQALGMRYQPQAAAQQAAMDPQQQFGQQFLKQVANAPHVSPPVQHGGHGGHGLPQLQPQQMQQTMAPQQHLLPQPPQQYASPQQQAFQQRQMAQMRMMQQQQQQQSRQGYPQGQQLQFFPPAMAQRQGSFAGHLPRGVAPPGVLQHPSQARRSSQQGQGDDQNDPLLMLNDMGGP